MNLTLIRKSTFAFGMGCALAGSLALTACNMSDDVPTGDGKGIAVKVADSSGVDLNFNDKAKKQYRATGEFDLESIREKMKDKGIDADDVQISDLSVTYDASTLKFLIDNQGVKYVLKIYVKTEGDTTDGVLALETKSGDLMLAFEQGKTLFQLGKDIFLASEGYPAIVAAIKDDAKKVLTVTTILDVPAGLQEIGNLKLNLVVTVSGKI